MYRFVLCAVVLMALLGCSSKEKIEIPKDTKPGPTSPPISIGN